VEIEVEFSEPMKNTPTLSITPLGVSPTLTATEPVNKRKTWSATVSELDIDDTGSDDGQQNLSFSGFDLNDNALLAISGPAPIDPAASINRDGSGNFPVVTGDDTLHRFRVGPVSGMQQVLLLCMKHPSLALPGDTPATLAGNIQTALNNYYSQASWSLVTFTVTATPDWINLDHDPGHYYAADMEPLMELVQESIDKAITQGVSFAGVDRVLVLTNESGARGDNATTGFWPYNVPGTGSAMISSSVHTLTTTNAHFTHAAGHHLGLVDLYPYPHVTTPRPFVGQWGHMGDRVNQPHFISWSKHRLGWITGSGNAEASVAKPDVGSPITNADYAVTPLETDTDDTKVVIIEVADRLAYYVENRKQTGLDSGLDEGGVIITKVNEYVEPGAGPSVVIDPNNDNDLTDACFNNGETYNDANVGLSIQVRPPTGTTENIRINYDPPSDRNDVSITRQDGRWQTPDIWVDAPDDGGNYAADPETVDDAARVGEPNRLYCRVWNMGDAPATDFRIIMEIREPWTTGTDFHKIDEFFVPVLAGSGAHATFRTVWEATAGVHTCVKVRIVDVSNDDNPGNNETQENIHRFETSGSSPYQPVTSKFVIGNPYDEEILVYLRVDGLPEGWPIELNPGKVRLGPKANVPATVKITPLEEAPRCSREEITITAYTPRGDTMVALGAITHRVHLVNAQNITHKTGIRCWQHEDPKGITTAYYKEETGRYRCVVTTNGCTNPARPNETVLIVYEAPDGSKIVRQVTTDENGCFEDYFNLGEAGIWEVKTVIEGDDCTQRAESDPTIVDVPGKDKPFGGKGQFLLSFHYGGSFPMDSFAYYFDNGFSLNLDAEWRFHPRASFVLYYGHHQFYSNSLANEYIRQYSLNGKYYLPWLGWRLFLQAGLGLYDPEFTGGEFGYNAGFGVQLPISGRLALELSTTYHKMVSERKYGWLSVQMGVAFEVFIIK
jgi:M6 family metalloprotease-like protein